MCAFVNGILPLLLANVGIVVGRYEPNWESLDTRPLPKWYDDAKIGIFVVWGLYSVPSFRSSWFWKFLEDNNKPYVEYMRNNFRPGFTYQDFGPQFTAEFYDPDEWADLFEAAGARYLVLTSKHHDGFTMWPSKYSWNWNVMDLGPRRDLLGDLARSIRSRTNIHFGLYHSLYEWFNPQYLMDKANKFKTNNFVVSKTMPELYELIKLYKPEIIWSDGDWEAPDWYWNSTKFLAWLFNESPVKDTVVVNDRWGQNISCHHGSYYNCKDRFNPGVLQTHKWENCMTLDKRYWEYNRLSKSSDYLTIEELLSVMITTISCGGNLLVNAGPTHEGRIDPIMEERLRQMGKWLTINGEAIYASKPWIFQNDSVTPNVWYTSKDKFVYATFLNWPKIDEIILGSVSLDVVVGDVRIHLLGYDTELKFKMSPTLRLSVFLPDLSEVKSDWAWVLKLEGIKIKKGT